MNHYTNKKEVIEMERKVYILSIVIAVLLGLYFGDIFSNYRKRMFSKLYASHSIR